MGSLREWDPKVWNHWENGQGERPQGLESLRERDHRVWNQFLGKTGREREKKIRKMRKQLEFSRFAFESP